MAKPKAEEVKAESKVEVALKAAEKVESIVSPNASAKAKAELASYVTKLSQRALDGQIVAAKRNGHDDYMKILVAEVDRRAIMKGKAK